MRNASGVQLTYRGTGVLPSLSKSRKKELSRTIAGPLDKQGFRGVQMRHSSSEKYLRQVPCYAKSYSKNLAEVAD